MVSQAVLACGGVLHSVSALAQYRSMFLLSAVVLTGCMKMKLQTPARYLHGLENELFVFQFFLHPRHDYLFSNS